MSCTFCWQWSLCSHELTGNSIADWPQIWGETCLFWEAHGAWSGSNARVGNCCVYTDNHLIFGLWSASIDLIRYVLIEEKCSGICPSAHFKLRQKSDQMQKKSYDSASASPLYRSNSGSNKLLLILLTALSIMRIKITILWSVSMFPLNPYLTLKNAAKCINLSSCTVQKRFLLFC